MFDFVSSGGSESELDRRGDDPHFIIYKQVRGNTNYGGNKRVYLQARYDL